jgi:hypothetical protein
MAAKASVAGDVPPRLSDSGIFEVSLSRVKECDLAVDAAGDRISLSTGPVTNDGTIGISREDAVLNAGCGPSTSAEKAVGESSFSAVVDSGDAGTV